MGSRSTVLSLLIAILFGSAGNGHGQAILEMREWTNADGKKIRAELLTFGNELRQGKIRLRLAGGKVFTLAPDALSREDQAIILKTKFEKLFRGRFSERMNAHFFYSKRISAAEQDDGTVAYIGNDIEGGWMRMRLNLDADRADECSAILLVRQGADSVRIGVSEDDVDYGRGSATVDVSLTDESDRVANLFTQPNQVRILLEDKRGKFSELKLSAAEGLALQEVSTAFRDLQHLTDDHVWWTTFQEISEKEFASLMAERNPPPEPPKPEPSKVIEPIVPMRDWTIAETEGAFRAEVMSFDRNRIVFRGEDRKVTLHGLTDLTPENRSVLAEARLRHALGRNWHPYDDRFAWHWPIDKTDSDARLAYEGLLFVIERETGKPGLFFQVTSGAPDETDPKSRPSEWMLTGLKIPMDLEFRPSPGTRKLRTLDRTTWWFPVSDEYAEVLVVASPALEGLRIGTELAGEAAEPVLLGDAEFKASIEALEIFRAWMSLLNEGEEEEPTEEPVTDTNDGESAEEAPATKAPEDPTASEGAPDTAPDEGDGE